jgi:hypothetical protein
MIVPLVSCNFKSNDKLSIVDIYLGLNKSVVANTCPLLTLKFKFQDNMGGHD